MQVIPFFFLDFYDIHALSTSLNGSFSINAVSNSLSSLQPWNILVLYGFLLNSLLFSFFFFFFFLYGTLHEFASHPCAGAMLIFSVSFQVYVLPKRALFSFYILFFGKKGNSSISTALIILNSELQIVHPNCLYFYCLHSGISHIWYYTPVIFNPQLSSYPDSLFVGILT